MLYLAHSHHILGAASSHLTLALVTSTHPFYPIAEIDLLQAILTLIQPGPFPVPKSPGSSETHSPDRSVNQEPPVESSCEVGVNLFAGLWTGLDR
ncbi:hypothetical protein BGZ63DRAFT_378239 [Mariannaea sp. PMI_226]|nr:hypothetical protein BGZ63DRAFT_378239 [Mariannaea sp. PMI_226]